MVDANFEGVTLSLSYLEMDKKSQIKGKWYVEIKVLLEFREVLYVKDLKANLLNISQICDEDWIV